MKPDIDLAIVTLHQVCAGDFPGSAKAQAARTLLELAGLLKNNLQDTSKLPLSEMSASELEERLRSLTGTV